ncbi:MAG: HupE/UreJ family protein [Alphaproteobacteria bacterium]|nr:HupE/UreJ family protein [Alphaproteobacteria bacterium]
MIDNAALLLLLLLLCPLPAGAHEIKPSLATVTLDDDGTYRVVIITNLEVLIAGVSGTQTNTNDAPEVDQYDHLRTLSPEELEAAFQPFKDTFLSGAVLRFDGIVTRPDDVFLNIPPVGDLDLPRESIVVLSGKIPPGATGMTWQWSADFGSSVIRAPSKTKDLYAAWLQSGTESAVIPVTGPPVRTFWDAAWDYFTVGYTHILPKGLDHILFVVGLFLLSPTVRPLLWQITAFTVAHSVTLALGMLGILTLSPKIVEPLIAASIVFVCVENLMTSRLHPWRPVVVFCFGLLHGLGFAGVLKEIGLGEGDFLTGLVAFNLGVEAGQLSIVAACFVGVFAIMHRPWYRRAVTIPASLAIGAIASWWTVERIFFT